MKLFHFTIGIIFLSACSPDVDLRNAYPPEQEWMLCNLATDQNGAYYTAETAPRPYSLRYAEEAKRRNLYCPSDLPRTTPRASIPRTSSTRVPPAAIPTTPAQSVTTTIPAIWAHCYNRQSTNLSKRCFSNL